MNSILESPLTSEILSQEEVQVISGCCRKGDQIRWFNANKPLKFNGLYSNAGGSGEIRTHERLTPSPVFKSMKFIIILKDLQRKNFRNYSKLMLIDALEYHRVGCGCGTVFSTPKPRPGGAVDGSVLTPLSAQAIS